MKRTLSILFIVLCHTMLWAQASYMGPDGKPADGPVKQRANSPIKAYRIDDRLGVADTVPIDTMITSYQDNNPINNYSIANSYNGNLGSPLQSKIYFDRKFVSPSMFSAAYNPYLLTPGNLQFFDAKSPYSELVWHSSLPKYHEEDYFRALFTINANKHLNIGGVANLIYGRGQYANQTARVFNGGLFAAYGGSQYTFNACILFNNSKNYENGGISDLNYIVNPDAVGGSYRSYNIPTNFAGTAISRYRNNIFYLNHKYSLGFKRERKLDNDSIVFDFIPVTSFIHTIKFEGIRHRFVESSVPTDFYENTYYNTSYTFDSTRYATLRNTLAVTLEEKFNKKLHFGLSAFVEHELRRYDVMSAYAADPLNGLPADTAKFAGFWENHLRVGAAISKNEGKWVKYNVKAQLNVLGVCAGEFNVTANLNTQFRIKNDTMKISAYAMFERYTADYFIYHYKSNHFNWDNKFDAYYDFRAGGKIAIPVKDIIDLGVGVNFSNISNPVYFNTSALPDQLIGNVQVLAVDAKVNLRAWKFHLDNQVVCQLTSNDEVIPLPMLALYSNFYFKAKAFKVLTVQLGANCRYHTAYHAPSYMPATGQFYNQRDVMIGNYPEMGVYANFHLKRMRFYAQCTNWNQKLFGGRRYFSMPYYPLNPATFRFGLSWTFYD